MTRTKTAAIVGCPFSGGQPKAGVDSGPDYIVQSGIVQQLEQLGWTVKFERHLQFQTIPPANDPPIGVIKNARIVSATCKRVAETVSAHVRAGEVPISLGGDHSLAMGTIYGSLDACPNVGVIYVDAHADLNTVESTSSGNLHGMPLSFVLGLNDPAHPVLSVFNWLKSSLDPSSIVYIGLRDLDESEKQLIRQLRIRAFSMRDINKHGIGKVIEMTLNHLNGGEGKRGRPLHVSFDIDALDPSIAPSTGVPVRGGLTMREGQYICEAVHETGDLIGFDLMEVNPTISDAEGVNKTVAAGCSVIRCALGESLL